MTTAVKENIKRNATLLVVVANIILTLSVVWYAGEWKGIIETKVDSAEKIAIEMKQKSEKRHEEFERYKEEKAEYLRRREINETFLTRKEGKIHFESIEKILKRIDSKIDKIDNKVNKY